jgi:hypothetical protein
MDWQSIAVLLIILAALIYTGRRTWAHLLSFRAKRADDSACATGCGSCSSSPKPKNDTPRTVFVEITRSRRSSRN